MKVAEAKTTATAAKSNAPFFQKGAAQSLPAAEEAPQPFFQKKQNDNVAIQAKLSIGQPNDKYEQEADAMADKVVQRLSSKPDVSKSNSNDLQAKPLAAAITPLVQKKCAACEEEEKLQKKEDDADAVGGKLQKSPIFEGGAEPPPDDNKPVQKKCDTCGHEKEKEVQKKADSIASQAASPSVEASLSSSKGSGSPLAESTRTQMESSFGADFSGVRVHNDSSAVQMSKDLNAQAFTHGNDVYFNQGKYDPQSDSGRHLLAHELTHTVQQGASISRKEDAPQIQKVPATEEQKQAIRNALAGLGVRIDDANVQEVYDQYPNGVTAERQVVFVQVSGPDYSSIARISAVKLTPAIPLPSAIELFVFEVGKGRCILASSIGGGSVLFDAGAGGANRSNSTSAIVLATHINNIVAAGLVAAPSSVRISHVDGDHYNALSSVLSLPQMGNAVVELTRQQLTQAIASGVWTTMNVSISPTQSIVQINVSGNGLNERKTIIGNLEIAEYRSEAAHTSLTTPGQRTYNKNNTSPVTILRDRVTNSTYVMTGDAEGRLLNDVVNMVGEDAFRRISGGGARNLSGVELPHHGGAVNSGPDVAGMTRFLRLMFEASNGSVNFFAQTSQNFSSTASASIRYLNSAQIPVEPIMNDPAGTTGVRNIRANVNNRIVFNGTQIASVIAMGNSNSTPIMQAYQMRDKLLSTAESLQVMEGTFRMIPGDGERLSSALGSARTETETHTANLNTDLSRFWDGLANAGQPSGMRASANTTQLQAEIANLQTRLGTINVEGIKNSIEQVRSGMSLMGRVFLNSLSMQQALRLRDLSQLNALKAEQRRLVSEVLPGARAELGKAEFNQQIKGAWEATNAYWNQNYVQRVAVRMGISEAQSRQVFFRATLAENLSRQMWLNDLARRAEAGQLPSAGPVPMRSRAGAGIMAAIELLRIGLEFYQSYEMAEQAEEERDRERRIQGMREVYWWLNMGIRPGIKLVDDSWRGLTTLNVDNTKAYKIINEEIPEADRPEYKKVVVDEISDADLLTVAAQFYLRFMTMSDWIEAMGNPDLNDRNTVRSSQVWFVRDSDGWSVKLWDSSDNEYKLSHRAVIQEPLNQLMVHLRQGQKDALDRQAKESASQGTSTIEDSAWIFGQDRIAYVYNSSGGAEEIDFDSFRPTFIKVGTTDYAYKVRGHMALVKAVDEETYRRMSRYYWVTESREEYMDQSGTHHNYSVGANFNGYAYVSRSSLIQKSAPAGAP